MKKNVRYLVVVLVCIAVLVGAVLVLTLTGGEEEAASSSAGRLPTRKAGILSMRSRRPLLAALKAAPKAAPAPRQR